MAHSASIPHVIPDSARRLHLAIDAVGIKHSGGATVLVDFLSAALEASEVARLTVFCSPRAHRNFTLPASDRIIEVEQPLAEQSYIYRMLWIEYVLPRECQRIGADALFSMAGVASSRPSVSQTILIQQSLSFSPEAMMRLPAKERVQARIRHMLMKRSCRAAQRVIVQTPTMKRWITESFDLPEDRVEHVIPIVRERPALPRCAGRQTALDGWTGAKLLYVGNDRAYKNVSMIARSMAALRRQIPGATLFVTWPTRHPIARQEGIVCLGYIPRDDLPALYQAADLVVMPSLVETIGLPMLEAMDAGVPVLAADRPYAHDVCEHAALYFDPLRPDDFVAKATQLLTDPAQRDSLRRHGRAIIARRRRSDPYGEMVRLVAQAAASRRAGSASIVAG